MPICRGEICDGFSVSRWFLTQPALGQARIPAKRASTQGVTQSLSPEHGGPVLHDGDRRDILLGEDVHQVTFAVRGYGILLLRLIASLEARPEERHRLPVSNFCPAAEPMDTTINMLLAAT